MVVKQIYILFYLACFRGGDKKGVEGRERVREEEREMNKKINRV